MDAKSKFDNDSLWDNEERVALIRTKVTHRGRTFIYMRPYKYRLWDSTVDIEQMKARIYNILYG